MSELYINSKERRERRTTPIYIKIEPPPITDSQIEELEIEFRDALMAAYNRFEKIPYTDKGCERVTQLFNEAYERVMSGQPSATITVTLEP